MDHAYYANEIIGLYETYGKEDYDGEPVSQASHMLQCAKLAINTGADDELILGAFLHDIGHMLGHKQQVTSMDKYGAVDHEGIGANYLQRAGFSNKICAVVAHHVNAKRYLVATNEQYSKKLSEASWQTLQWQGGPMISNEVETFREHPYFDDIIMVRLWDEQAKNPGEPVPSLEQFKQRILQHLSRQTHAHSVSNF